MENLHFAFNAIAPIFIIVFIGAVLRITGVINDDYVKRSSTIVFHVTLPALIVARLLDNHAENLGQGLPLAIFLVWTLLFYGGAWLFAAFRLRHPPSRGAFVQGCYRSNIAILGLPILANLLGSEQLVRTVIYLAVAMPVYNVMAVVVLALTTHQTKRLHPFQMLASIVRNPLILAVLAGILLARLGIRLPAFATRTIASLAELTFPLALLGIGASLRRSMLGRTGAAALGSALLKTVALPAAVTATAILAGVRGNELAILFVVAGCPTAVSSFIMAKAMHSDAELAAGIVFLSTLISALTLGTGVFLLRFANFI